MKIKRRKKSRGELVLIEAIGPCDLLFIRDRQGNIVAEVYFPDGSPRVKDRVIAPLHIVTSEREVTRPTLESGATLDTFCKKMFGRKSNTVQ